MATVKANKRSSRAQLRNILFAFPLVAAALLSHTPRARADYASGIDTQYNSGLSNNENCAMNFVVRKLEGEGYVANDNGEGPSKWGILGSANGLSGQQVYDLSFADAERIYDQKYWHQINNIDRMSFPMEVVAFNAAVNIGPSEANIMVADAHGDPHVVMRETQEWYNHLDQSVYGPAWAQRQREVASFVRDQSTDMAPGASFAENDLSAQNPVKQISRAVPKQTSLLPEADAATMTPSVSPATAPKDLPPTGEDMELAASSMAGDIPIWAMIMAPLIALWRRLFPSRRRKSHNYTPDETPTFVTVNGVRPEATTAENGLRAAKGYASGEQKSGNPSRQFNQDHLTGFSELERAAFSKMFAHHFADIATKPQSQWHVKFDDKSYSVIEAQRVTLFGNNDKQIEHTLIYAAQAWGGCKVGNATPEYCDNMSRIAQKLIDEGRLPKTFVMEGVPSFATAPAAVPEPAPQKSAPSRPERMAAKPFGWHNRTAPIPA